MNGFLTKIKSNKMLKKSGIVVGVPHNFSFVGVIFILGVNMIHNIPKSLILSKSPLFLTGDSQQNPSFPPGFVIQVAKMLNTEVGSCDKNGNKVRLINDFPVGCVKGENNGNGS